MGVVLAGFAAVVALWWTYFDLNGAVQPRRGWWAFIFAYGHVPLWIALTAFGAGVKLAIKHAEEVAHDPGSRWALAGGAALFFLSVAFFHLASSRREPPLISVLRIVVVVAGLIVLAAAGTELPQTTVSVLVTVGITVGLMLEALSVREAERGALMRMVRPPERMAGLPARRGGAVRPLPACGTAVRKHRVPGGKRGTHWHAWIDGRDRALRQGRGSVVTELQAAFCAGAMLGPWQRVMRTVPDRKRGVRRLRVGGGVRNLMHRHFEACCARRCQQASVDHAREEREAPRHRGQPDGATQVAAINAQCVHVGSLCLRRLCVCALAHLRQINPMAARHRRKQGRESVARNVHA